MKLKKGGPTLAFCRPVRRVHDVLEKVHEVAEKVSLTEKEVVAHGLKVAEELVLVKQNGEQPGARKGRSGVRPAPSRCRMAQGLRLRCAVRAHVLDAC